MVAHARSHNARLGPPNLLVIPVFPIRGHLLDQPSPRVAARNRCPQFLKLGLKKVVGNDHRLYGLARIATTRRDGLIDGSL
jgi:hypothetical protein